MINRAHIRLVTSRPEGYGSSGRRGIVSAADFVHIEHADNKRGCLQYWIVGFRLAKEGTMRWYHYIAYFIPDRNESTCRVAVNAAPPTARH